MKGLIRPKLSFVLAAFALAVAMAYSPAAHAAAPSGLVALPSSVPAQVTSATLMGPHQAAPGEQFTVELLLAMNNQSQLHTLMSELYNPHSSRYHHWLKTGEFDARFGPTASQVAAAKSFLTGAGLTLVSENTSAFLLEAQGTLDKIKAAFHVSIMDYRSSDGTTFFANDTDVQIPASLSGTIQGVLGLNNIPAPLPRSQPSGKPTNYGGGPGGSGLTPSQLAGIYNADPVYRKLHDKGQGVTLGLFELGDYTHSDIAVYEKQFGLRRVPITIVPVAGGSTDHVAAGEIELDIEAQIALAPGAKRILVYEAPPTTLDIFAIEALQIAADNKADVVSVSYGVCERNMPTAVVLGENVAYAEMALQGQSAFVSSGDAGAFACLRGPGAVVLPLPEALQVDDPGSQPFVTSVGGTSFAGTFDPGTKRHPKYPGSAKELVWNSGCLLTACMGATGGGVSRNWAALSTQVGPGVNEPGLSQSGAYCGQVAGVPCREVPDVSLVADPASGFAEYCTDPVDCVLAVPPPVPGWFAIGGTSLSSPLWSAIAALLQNHEHERVGLLTLAVYEDDSVDGFHEEFHDITSGDNGFYPAGPFYDMSTGIGSTDIFNLVTQLDI